MLCYVKGHIYTCIKFYFHLDKQYCKFPFKLDNIQTLQLINFTMRLSFMPFTLTREFVYGTFLLYDSLIVEGFRTCVVIGPSQAVLD